MILKKKGYVENNLNRIEREYGNISYCELEEIRINSSICYHEGSDTDGTFYKVHALDEGQENINLMTKKLPIDSTEESWKIHSPNVMVCRRCINFEKQEYTRTTDVFDLDRKNNESKDDYTTCRTKPTIPKSTLERMRLSLFFR